MAYITFSGFKLTEIAFISEREIDAFLCLIQCFNFFKTCITPYVETSKI